MNTAAMAKVLGRRGGQARARRLDASERRRIASTGAAARARSLEAARRIEHNLRYAAAVSALRGDAPRVARLGEFNGRLPGLYPADT
jgi:hypothetical protein